MDSDWSDWSDDECVEFDKELWESFECKIPHVGLFIELQQRKDEVSRANERFNKFYYGPIGERETKVTFSKVFESNSCRFSQKSLKSGITL